MSDEQTDLEEKVTPDGESENKAEEKTNQDQTVEDTEANDQGGDDDKQEGDDDKDPYQEKLAELENQNRRKGAALTEKNRKIVELKKQLSEQGLDEDTIKSVIDDAIGSKLSDIESTRKKLDEALKLAEENNIDTLLGKYTDNDGEKKIYRYFLDKKVNKTLPFKEQVSQAVALGKDAMSDEKFQKDVEKANQLSKRSSGRQSEGLVDMPANIKNMADAMFQTKEGKKQFYEEYRKNLNK